MRNFNWAAVIGAALFAASCGGDDSSAREKQIEKEAKKYGVDADVTLDKDGNVETVKINGPGGAEVGKNLKLPDGFPSDVPVSKDWAVMAIAPAQQDGYMVQALTDADTSATIEAVRRDFTAKGWKETAYDQPAPQMTRISFLKDDRMTNINLIVNGEQVAVQMLTMNRP